ncbi:ABC transporter permease [Alsobacter sp. SYSU M60028]|uniref:ABC transporter permease n=1 Tax=Alsobacter ponti TaxID=2962936 RepID=A0ABT1L7Y2_9HYPH|nr:ABC transporter permease [Alsobacter ponti]MCP8937579.1 ABC transporter permease [Alsobacter ponti]
MADIAAAPRRRRRRPNLHLLVGGSLLGLFVALAVLGPTLAPYDPMAQDLFATMEPPTAAHWLGADQVGRDILSRIMAGTRYTLSIALASVAAAALIGVALGSIAGHFGGRVDRAVTGFVDLLLTIPNLVLAIAIASAVGSSPTGLTVAIAASFVPSIARLVRSRVLELREEDFVNAAVTIGMSPWRVLARHVLPNAISVIVVETSLLAGQAVLVGSALGFLGLGVQPPAPEWGAMLGASREALEIAPHLVMAPGLAISLLVFAFNTFGDGLRDRFDPNMQQR